jgi:hypothetical protein
MISGVPLFRGRDNNDQLNAIIKVVGTPDERTFRKIMQDSVSPSSPSSLEFISSIPLVARSAIPPTAEIPQAKLPDPPPARITTRPQPPRRPTPLRTDAQTERQRSPAAPLLPRTAVYPHDQRANAASCFDPATAATTAGGGTATCTGAGGCAAEDAGGAGGSSSAGICV